MVLKNKGPKLKEMMEEFSLWSMLQKCSMIKPERSKILKDIFHHNQNQNEMMEDEVKKM